MEGPKENKLKKASMIKDGVPSDVSSLSFSNETTETLEDHRRGKRKDDDESTAMTNANAI